MLKLVRLCEVCSEMTVMKSVTNQETWNTYMHSMTNHSRQEKKYNHLPQVLYQNNCYYTKLLVSAKNDDY